MGQPMSDTSRKFVYLSAAALAMISVWSFGLF